MLSLNHTKSIEDLQCSEKRKIVFAFPYKRLYYPAPIILLLPGSLLLATALEDGKLQRTVFVGSQIKGRLRTTNHSSAKLEIKSGSCHALLVIEEHQACGSLAVSC